MGVFSINYSSTRASFMKKLQELLEDDFEDFESLENGWMIIQMQVEYIYGPSSRNAESSSRNVKCRQPSGQRPL